ncbi:alkanesulfonate monooxygenase, partial [Bacillus cereus]|nr:alkanesulfonate monooxygenase [Bacillus cereus]
EAVLYPLFKDENKPENNKVGELMADAYALKK